MLSDPKLHLDELSSRQRALAEETGKSQKLVTVVIRAIAVTFITVAAGIFALVLLSIFGGLPLVFA